MLQPRVAPGRPGKRRDAARLPVPRSPLPALLGGLHPPLPPAPGPHRPGKPQPLPASQAPQTPPATRSGPHRYPPPGPQPLPAPGPPPFPAPGTPPFPAPGATRASFSAGAARSRPEPRVPVRTRALAGAARPSSQASWSPYIPHTSCTAAFPVRFSRSEGFATLQRGKSFTTGKSFTINAPADGSPRAQPGIVARWRLAGRAPGRPSGHRRKPAAAAGAAHRQHRRQRCGFQRGTPRRAAGSSCAYPCDLVQCRW